MFYTQIGHQTEAPRTAKYKIVFTTKHYQTTTYTTTLDELCTVYEKYELTFEYTDELEKHPEQYSIQWLIQQPNFKCTVYKLINGNWIEFPPTVLQKAIDAYRQEYEIRAALPF